jgi:sec-independent protein translocase protein TatC
MVMPDAGSGPADADQPGVRLVGNRANPEARMPLMEHIRELRNRIIKVAVVVTVGAVLGWYLYPHVWAFIERPYCRVPQPKDEFAGKGCHLFVSTLFAGLFLRLKIAIITGVVITSPFWFYQLWAFIAPGLYRRERRWGYFFAGTAIPLFLAGGATAYFAMTKGIRFLLELVPSNVTPIITIDTYLSYALAMLAIFGIAFEVPLVFVLLNLAGVLTHDRFRKMRRVIIFLVFAFAAVFTPSPDPISMLLLAVPCVVLVEAAEIFVWANDRRRARLGVQYPGMTAEEVARYGLE